MLLHTCSTWAGLRELNAWQKGSTDVEDAALDPARTSAHSVSLSPARFCRSHLNRMSWVLSAASLAPERLRWKGALGGLGHSGPGYVQRVSAGARKISRRMSVMELALRKLLDSPSLHVWDLRDDTSASRGFPSSRDTALASSASSPQSRLPDRMHTNVFNVVVVVVWGGPSESLPVFWPQTPMAVAEAQIAILKIDVRKDLRLKTGSLTQRCCQLCTPKEENVVNNGPTGHSFLLEARAWLFVTSVSTRGRCGFRDSVGESSSSPGCLSCPPNQHQDVRI
ncbi:hypothetical protein EYF80_003161 [Liparis tanakae]|uniref:Uncharacterized protein n=1 Tax=Liparis tanakae TaxID=230148 RepID=A0A4Z2JAD5_9TELE|nr:hypothetical protein EYF80_003161 [Liparis tanakae]